MPHRKKRLIFAPRVGDCLESRVNLSASATNGLAAAIGALDDSSPPSTAVTPVERLDPYAVQRHAANVAIADAGKTDVVFFGDSITDFFETGPGSPVWQREIAPLNAADFGVSGDQTQHLLWRLQNGELDGHPKVAVVNIGTNNLADNTTSETAAGVAAVVQQIEALSPKTKILLMGLFPRGASPTDPVRAEVQQVNALISGLADGDHIRYLDIGSDFLRPDGTLPNGLFYDSVHPSTAGYQVWADAILSPLAAMLGQPAPDPSHYGGPVLVDTPAALTVEASGPQGALVSFPMPLAFDGVDPHPAVTSTVPSGSVFPVGTTVVTFMATDSAGRRASTSLPITVRDTTSLGTSSRSTQVSLSGVSNMDGITNDNNTTVGNLDRAGDSYSADALGTTVTWGGAAFNIGAATANNVVRMGGVPISLPQGNYSSIKLLGTGTYGVQPGTFIVHYTDGTTDSFTQAFSDWRGGYTGAGTTAPGESIAVTMTHFNAASGRVNQTVYLYGYSFPLDPRKTVSYMEVPNDNNIKVLAIDELYQPPQVNLSSAYKLNGISTDNNPSIANLDRAGDSYSADALGTTVTWGGAAFNIGAATANNVVRMGGVPISLPQGNYSSIKLLGTGTYGVQPGTFIVHYTDGTTDSFTQAFSDWRGGYTGAGTTAPGESIAVTMTHFNAASGRVNQTVYLYGYSFPLDPRKTVSYMEVPNDNDIKVLAIDELYQHLSG